MPSQTSHLCTQALLKVQKGRKICKDGQSKHVCFISSEHMLSTFGRVSAFVPLPNGKSPNLQIHASNFRGCRMAFLATRLPPYRHVQPRHPSPTPYNSYELIHSVHSAIICYRDQCCASGVKEVTFNQPMPSSDSFNCCSRMLGDIDLET